MRSPDSPCRWSLAVLLLLCLVVPSVAVNTLPAHASTGWAVRINAGGGAFTDREGRTWAADTGNVGGATASTTAAIAGTTEPRLYQSERWGASGYRIAVPAVGLYRVRLHLAEITFDSINRRVFSVSAEGRPVIESLDLVAVAGRHRAHVVTSDVLVSDGTLDIALRSTINHPTVAGIEVLPATVPSSGTIRINAGGGPFTSSDGRVWLGDQHHVGGSTAHTTATIAGTSDPRLYQSERWGSSGYRIPVAAGRYRLHLHLAEIAFRSPNRRVFTITAEGRAVASNLDLVAAVGARKAHVLTTEVAVADGVLDLGLRASVNHPTLAGIEVVPLDGGVTTTTTTPAAATSPTTVPPAAVNTTTTTTSTSTTAPSTTSTTMPTTTRPTTTAGRVSLNSVIYDHYGAPFRSDGYFGAPWGRHEAAPLGVPTSWNWQAGAIPGARFPTTTYRATSGWGQVAEDIQGSPVRRVRLQVRNFRMFFLTGDNRWVEARPNVDDRMIEGAHWTGTYEATDALAIRDEAVNGGGSSVSLQGIGTSINGRTRRFAHFWWKSWYPREPIPAGARGAFISCEMRLIPDGDPTVDLSRARYVASASADVYQTTSDATDRNAGLSQPRMRYLTGEWQTFTGYNLTEAELRATPPPIIG